MSKKANKVNKPTLKTRKETTIGCFEWDAFIKEIYGKPYCFQQQDDCKDRGNFYFSAPEKRPHDYKRTSCDYEDESQMGVSFAAWLARDPKEKLPNQEYDFQLDLFWERQFYPHVSMIINDLYRIGVIEAGDYVIDIDW